MTSLSPRYLAMLRIHLNPQSKGGRRQALAFGRDAVAQGCETLDLARMHEAALVELAPRHATVRQALQMRRQSRSLFLAALLPFDQRHRSLKQEIIKRREAEAALIESERHQIAMLKQSQRMELRMRMLSRQMLAAQEEERKKISREVHDQISQMLAGINVHLASVKAASLQNNAGVSRRLRLTQKMVERSVDVVHRFARELRPPVLDDLGLIPALQAHFKSFTERMGIPVQLTVYAGVEELENNKRTVLFRIAQAALTNVAQHAQATRVVVTVLRTGSNVEMSVRDNGRGFDAERMLSSTTVKRLGLIGMRERVEMIGGVFEITSKPSAGTVVTVRLPGLPKAVRTKRIAA